MKGFSVIVYILSMSICAQIDTGRLFMPSDIVYKGAFKLPGKSGTSQWRYGGGALTFNPHGDPGGKVDGYPGSLFGVGHIYQNHVSEISIPAPLVSTNYDDLPVATTLQPFADITQGLMNMDQGPASADRLGGLQYMPDGSIFWAAYKYYYVMPEDMNGFGISTSTLSSPNAGGLWHAGSYHSIFTTDYLFLIPQWWADQYAPGTNVIGGRARSSGRGHQSEGPPFYAIEVPAGSPANGTILPAVRLAFYSPGSDEWPDYKMVNQYFAGAWLEAGNKSSIIVTATEGGSDCYGSAVDCNDLCGGNKGSHGYPYTHRLLFYDPMALGKVAQGHMQPNEVMPYHVEDLDNRLFWNNNCRNGIEALAYDRDNGIIYAFQYRSDKPVIHVWSIAHLIPAAVDEHGQKANLVAVTITVNPNPGRSSFAVRIRGNENTGIRAGVYDINGRLYYRISNRAYFTCNADAWPSGMYIVRVETAGRVLSRRLVIQK
ncbi:MAG: hypothetical protein A2487_10605 [Candidatus Raymondbacteria bacterium RifOxyC12_full_50_8]|uniref:Secretion system C-terminal sorting domain-containing protein n=1 Tax=Candidatus Raymondbacteria bacterium RIFOXYD12_FULL_49_13 TaxID=1817890 RepID=A0A1F7F190_UNCRA|nr:MAG: hypothetical protein A2248_07895 [Candidatus Raymondbacteria bacterium RIFOXYA2_FULL_49_16]OGJ96587.1 MAG: hypothetical protein A2487_10605 [Candidatus Raymondbacteria bacterium RifOxyC12_full_50_8]OGK00266.1 MAG: hypothetical protein A2519_01270 [Candidatus Raymondbacteria bacterium RIFOXYD12_FULL_49_13]OGK02096.1 MAG: hypothetical protein A2350_21295 [Candidatus Raymondbacteria bacterium RifOxyB12_full_50_8]OGP42325.1 MAG: hypothetical protein A2324_20125 [Candidatus Raymondbacteria b